jgi:hypothetical protein
MRFVVFLAQWSGEHCPTVDEVQQLTFGVRQGLLVRKQLLGLSTIKYEGKVMMCMHTHPAREEAEVIEALTNAFNPRDLVVTGVPSNLRQGNGLLAALMTPEQKQIFLFLEAGFLGNLPHASTYARDEFSIFGGRKPLPPRRSL